MPQTSPENVQLPKHLLEKDMRMRLSEVVPQKTPGELLSLGADGTASGGLFRNGEAPSSHLNGAVEEAAVLSRLIHQAFGERQRHHASRLVGLFQAFSRFLEHLNPCFGVRACSFQGKKTKTNKKCSSFSMCASQKLLIYLIFSTSGFV